MAIEMRSIRCHHFRATPEPCMNPAVVEVLGPQPHLLCAEHAAVLLEAGSGWAHKEGWELYGAEKYVRHCEQAADALEEWSRINRPGSPYPDNLILGDILEEAFTYLTQYELERARTVLERAGGERRETLRERDTREYLEQAFGQREKKREEREASLRESRNGSEASRCHVGSATDNPCRNPATVRVNSENEPDMCAAHALQVSLQETENAITASLEDLEDRVKALLTDAP